MKRRTKIVAAAALIALAGVLIHLVVSLGSWRFHIPQIDAVPAASGKPASATASAAPVVASVHPDRKLPRFGENLPARNATTSGSQPPPVVKRPALPEVGPPYWCFRTYYPGMPWMMSTDERVAGNGAHIATDLIWNGLHSLRMDLAPLLDKQGLPLPRARAQRNVLWQAVHAEPYRGKRIAFRPWLRAMPGGSITAFLRSWNGSTGAPLLDSDRIYPAKTPTVSWSSAWGNPYLLLDVPMDAKFVYYGIVQFGARQVWIDRVTLESDPVLPDAPANSPYMVGTLEGLPSIPIDPNWVWDKPSNLDFEIVDPDEYGNPLPDTPPLPC